MKSHLATAAEYLRTNSAVATPEDREWMLAAADELDSKQWMRDVVEDAAPMIRESAYFIQLFGSGDGNPRPQAMLELGLGVFYDKPLLVVVEPAARDKVPASMHKLGWVIEVDMDAPDAHARMAKEIRAFIDEHG